MSKLSEAIDWNRKKNKHGLQRVDAAKPKSYLGQGIDSMGPGKVSRFLEQKAKGRTEPVKGQYEAGENIGRGPAPTPWPTEKQKTFPTQKKQPAWMASEQPYAAEHQRQPPPKSVGTADPSGPLAAPVTEPLRSHKAGSITWKNEKWKQQKAGKSDVFQSKYKTSGGEPTSESSGQGAFQRYVQEETPEERWQGYLALMEQPDFEEKSGYQSTKHGEAKLNLVTGTYLDTGYDDILYDYVNGAGDAQHIQDHNDLGTAHDLYATTHKGWRDLPESVVRLFNYIYSTKSPEEAYQYLDLVAPKGYTAVESMALGTLNGSGASSVSAAIGSGLSHITGDKKDVRKSKEWYDDLKKDMSRAGEEHPLAYGAGSVGGNLGLVMAIAYGAEAVPGFIALPDIAQAAVQGAAAFGGSKAVQGLGDVAVGEKSFNDYGLDVLTNAGAGAVGGALASGVGAAGTAFLQSKGLAENTLARVVLAGFTGVGGVVGRESVAQGSAYLRDPEDYELDEEQLLKEALVGFAFSAFGYLARSYARPSGTGTQAGTDKTLADKYFGGMSEEEARREWHRLAKLYHPDVNPGDATAEAMFKEINAAYASLTAVQGGSAYQNMQKAWAGGDMGAYRQAKADFDGAVTDLTAITQALPATEAQEALQILQAVSAGMSGAENDGSALVSDTTADDLLRSESTVKFLSKRGGLELKKGMTQEQKRAAIRQAVENVVHKEKTKVGDEGSLDTKGAEGYDEIKKTISGGLTDGGAEAGLDGGREAENHGDGREVLWREAGTGHAGGRSTVEQGPAFVERAKAEGKTVIQDGKWRYAYKITQKENYGPQTQQAVEAAKEWGLFLTVVDSIEKNNGKTTFGRIDGTTSPEGAVFLVNGCDSEVVAHEGVHSGLRRNIREAQKYLEATEQVNITSKKVQYALQKIVKSYYEEGSREYDFEHLKEETAAFISGMIETGRAEEVFGLTEENSPELFAAWREFKTAMGANPMTQDQAASDGNGEFNFLQRDTLEPKDESLVSDETADKLLGEWSSVKFLTRKGGLKLNKKMTQEQKRAAVREAVARITNERKSTTSSGLVEEKSQVQVDPTIETAEEKERQMVSEEQDDLRETDISQVVDPVEKVLIERYNEIVKGLRGFDGESVFLEAKNGGRHKGVYNDAVKKKQVKLKKSIMSHMAQVEEHADKMKHPEKYDTGWMKKDNRQRLGLLKKWEKDLRRNAEQAEIEIEVWKDRFENDK